MKRSRTAKSIGALLCAVFLCAIIGMGIVLFRGRDTVSCNAEGETGGRYEQIDSYLTTAAENAHVPSMSVTIVDRESTLFSGVYGDCESTDVPYLLGSVSKSFTALCIMQLAEQGKVNLDETLSAYLPDATDGDKMTIRQLLHHTSGLGEHQRPDSYSVIGKQGEFVYANVNYALLGKVIETVSGVSYETYVEENVFVPLGMNRTAAAKEKSLQNGLIEGHRNWFGWSVSASPRYPESDHDWISVPAGYLSSSTADLGKYLQMYLNGGAGIVSSGSIDAMLYGGVKVATEIPYEYGMGWTLYTEPFKQPVLRHSGLVETGMSCIYLLPESGVGIAIAVNTNDYFVTSDFMDRIGWSIPMILEGNAPDEIGGSEYIHSHLGYDAAYLVVFVLSLLPLCLLGRYRKRLIKGSLLLRAGFLVLLHAALPCFLLAIPQLFFSTPLWVVQAFVPDLFLTVILSACLLFLAGLVKTFFIILHLGDALSSKKGGIRYEAGVRYGRIARNRL